MPQNWCNKRPHRADAAHSRRDQRRKSLSIFAQSTPYCALAPAPTECVLALAAWTVFVIGHETSARQARRLRRSQKGKARLTRIATFLTRCQKGSQNDWLETFKLFVIYSFLIFKCYIRICLSFFCEKCVPPEPDQNWQVKIIIVVFIITFAKWRHIWRWYFGRLVWLNLNVKIVTIGVAANTCQFAMFYKQNNDLLKLTNSLTYLLSHLCPAPFQQLFRPFSRPEIWLYYRKRTCSQIKPRIHSTAAPQLHANRARQTMTLPPLASIPFFVTSNYSKLAQWKFHFLDPL